jgi:hypothetical protein
MPFPIPDDFDVVAEVELVRVDAQRMDSSLNRLHADSSSNTASIHGIHVQLQKIGMHQANIEMWIKTLANHLGVKLQ